MKMIIELNAAEAKIAIENGAILHMFGVLADFEADTKKPAEEFVSNYKSIEPTPMVAQQPVGVPTPPPQTPVGQPMYPSSLPNTVQQPVPPTGPVQQQMQPQVTIPVSTAPTYNMDQLAVAATQLVDAGQLELLRGILQNFGVTALTELQKDKYGEFATVLRQNGVKI